MSPWHTISLSIDCLAYGVVFIICKSVQDMIVFSFWNGCAIPAWRVACYALVYIVCIASAPATRRRRVPLFVLSDQPMFLDVENIRQINFLDLYLGNFAGHYGKRTIWLYRFIDQLRVLYMILCTLQNSVLAYTCTYVLHSTGFNTTEGSIKNPELVDMFWVSGWCEMDVNTGYFGKVRPQEGLYRALSKGTLQHLPVASHPWRTHASISVRNFINNGCFIGTSLLLLVYF